MERTESRKRTWSLICLGHFVLRCFPVGGYACGLGGGGGGANWTVVVVVVVLWWCWWYIGVKTVADPAGAVAPPSVPGNTAIIQMGE